MRRSEFIELGMRLTTIRKKLKMSQRRFAAACGMSNNYLSEVEKGQHQPGYDFLMRMVNKFKVNFNYLTTGEKNTGQAKKNRQKEPDFTAAALFYTLLS